MLTGVIPPEDTGWPTRTGTPSSVMRSTETWLLPASTASRYLPSLVTCIAPWDARPEPSPMPPAGNGEPGIGLSEPSACRSNPAMVLAGAVVLSST